MFVMGVTTNVSQRIRGRLVHRPAPVTFNMSQLGSHLPASVRETLLDRRETAIYNREIDSYIREIAAYCREMTTYRSEIDRYRREIEACRSAMTIYSREIAADQTENVPDEPEMKAART